MAGLADITVEVRDKALVRLGAITPSYLSLELRDEVNNVGWWKLTLPAEHHLVNDLKTPGSGIIVSNSAGIMMSGPMIKSEFAATSEDRQGTIVFEGVSDSIILADALAFPQPSNSDPNTQTVGYDERTDEVEDLMHAYVNENIGPSASVARKKTNLTMGTSAHGGAIVTKAARFETLGELLADLAKNTDIGFRVVQVGSNLQFQTYAYADRTATVRLDVNNGTLASSKVAYAPPGLTRAIMGGMGEEEDRLMGSFASVDSAAAETEWGRRIERFIDAREIDDPADLAEASVEPLTAEGKTKVAAAVIPIDGTTMVYGTDWTLGDKVTVVINGTEFTNVVNGIALMAGSDGYDVGILFGDDATFDTAASLTANVVDTTNRVSALERTAESNPVAVAALADPPACRLNNSVGYTATGGGTTDTLSFDSERYDTALMHSTVTNPSRITFPVAGIYQFGGYVVWGANNTSYRYLQVRMNGTTQIARTNLVSNTSTTLIGQEVHGAYKFAAGDYIEMQCATGSTGSLAINQAEFFATRLGSGV